MNTEQHLAKHYSSVRARLMGGPKVVNNLHKVLFESAQRRQEQERIAEEVRKAEIEHKRETRGVEPETFIKIIDMDAMGFSPNEISHAVKRPYTTIYSIIRRHGPAMRECCGIIDRMPREILEVAEAWRLENAQKFPIWRLFGKFGNLPGRDERDKMIHHVRKQFMHISHVDFSALFLMDKNVMLNTLKRGEDLTGEKIILSVNKERLNDPTFIETCAAMWASGASVYDIASNFGLSHQELRPLVNARRDIFPARPKNWRYAA